MHSNKFLETARKIIRENPEMFRALEEYDKTKRLPKLNYKIRANFTLDSDLYRYFRIYCKKNNLVMSKIIEKHLREELRKWNN